VAETGTKSLTKTQEVRIQTIRDDIERPADGIGFPRTLRRLVEGKNIHTDTLLATDYLNHFNEIVMLLEIVPDMPECLDDALEWQPKAYEDHFADSTFQDKALAAFAYENAPRRYREPFDQLVAQMDHTVLTTLTRIQDAMKTEDLDRVRHIVATTSKKMQRYVDVASAVIHGRALTSGQDEIDAMLAEIEVETSNPASTSVQTTTPEPAPAESGVGATQDDVDALFD